MICKREHFKLILISHLSFHERLFKTVLRQILRLSKVLFESVEINQKQRHFDIIVCLNTITENTKQTAIS